MQGVERSTANITAATKSVADYRRGLNADRLCIKVIKHNELKSTVFIYFSFFGNLQSIKELFHLKKKEKRIQTHKNIRLQKL